MSLSAAQKAAQKNKKKKGRRTDFVMKTVETAGSETIEEDGMKIIKKSEER